MHFGVVTLSLLLMLLLQLPHPAQASWWNSDADHGGLDLEAGYDANTVTTLSGSITALHLDGSHPRAQVEIDAGAGAVSVVFGPLSYWHEHGIDLKVGDRLTVRGSKAQGQNGVVYILAQWLSEESRGRQVTLRGESGRPAWAGTGSRSGQAGSHAGMHPQRAPGRIGMGRMGR